tara:strand:- start:1247 stop:2110 length:864 start_codon:yes stop_codon:yes gene_type:complete
MKALFTLLSIIPRFVYSLVAEIIVLTGIYKQLDGFKITKANLTIIMPNLSSDEIELESIKSYKQTFISTRETFIAWSRSSKFINSNILVIKNNYLLSEHKQKNKGFMMVAIHSRSVDMLLSWINSQTPSTSLYKKIKFRLLDKYVRKIRENKINKVYETGMLGVKKLLNALNKNEVVCMAADQVPQRGMGEYVDFFGRKSYTTTLIPRLALKTNKTAIFCSINKANNAGCLGVNLHPSSEDLYDKSKHLLSLNQSIEKLIYENIYDYSWEYKKYRRPYQGDKDPYKF